jgi:thermitase
VAVLDSGSDYTHEDLRSKIISKGKDFINNDDDAMDDNGHGTHCAGLVAAATNNGLGGAGMGYNISIIPVKVLSAGGGGSYDAIIGGMKWAADGQARVLSMSLGGYGYSSALQDAADYVASRGKIIVAAAGNDNLDAATTPAYPANLKNVFSVAATNASDVKAGFSNYGDKEIDIAAPGEGIYSTIWPGGGYANASGTSMACPIVAGLVGLVWSYSPNDKNTQILDAIMKTSDNVGPFVISGRINAFRAVDYFTVSTPIPATLVSRSIFQGTSVTGSAPVANIRSINAAGAGQIAAISATYKMPSNPIAGLKKTSITTTFGAHATGTAQLFLWNYSTGKYDLVNSVPGSGGRISYDTAVMPAQYYDRTTRNFTLIVRMLVPNRSGSSTSPFVLPVNSMSAVFSYRANP